LTVVNLVEIKTHNLPQSFDLSMHMHNNKFSAGTGTQLESPSAMARFAHQRRGLPTFGDFLHNNNCEDEDDLLVYLQSSTSSRKPLDVVTGHDTRLEGDEIEDHKLSPRSTGGKVRILDVE